ncbi:hypothetical protein EW145_g2010 [Phellinidium pouzarii]|uniref:Flavin reductase like domain-containing protein n=1 Tax=Phellinidium pouzarii TaxID=167371 RepID=A0A4S4LCE6_9AGAM|nr:hypothetical protein EW145_g2010 [Phellinidium pouzarii]
MSDNAKLPPFDASLAFHKTQSPDIGWTLGSGMRDATPLARQWKEDERLGWKTLDFDKMEKPDVYRLLTSAITPRPVAFVSTLSASGEPNLAPFSYFSMVSHNPPLVSISCTLPSNRPKDTRENIKETKEFVVNIISEAFVDAASSTSIEAPADIDEWAVSGLTSMPSLRQLYHFLDITLPELPSSGPTGSLILGRIRRAHIRRAVLTKNTVAPGSETDSVVVDPALLRPIARLGGDTFARLGTGFDIARPSWRALEGEVRALQKRQGHDE